jgi:hypothetical protein
MTAGIIEHLPEINGRLGEEVRIREDATPEVAETKQ